VKKLIPILAVGFLVVSCDAIKGNLRVNEELTLKAKKTGLFSSGTKDIKVPVAVYEAKLNPTSKTNINLEIEVGGKDQKIPFKMAEGTTLPEVEGRVDILGGDSGQPYDLQANVRTDVSKSNFDQNESCVSGYRPEQRCQTTPASRSCTLIPAHEECHDVRVRPDRDRDGRPDRGTIEVRRECVTIAARENCIIRPATTNCWMEQVAVYGSQIVNYERTTSVKHIDVDLVAAGKPVAQFNHANTSSFSTRIGSSMCQ
jgi:hypothetical protein